MDVGSLRVGLTPRLSSICMKNSFESSYTPRWAENRLNGPPANPQDRIPTAIAEGRNHCLSRRNFSSTPNLALRELAHFASQPDKYVYNVLEPLGLIELQGDDEIIVIFRNASDGLHYALLTNTGHFLRRISQSRSQGLDRLQNFCSNWAACVQAVFYVREPIS